MEKKRIGWVDSLKGIGMLSVILGHVVNGLKDADMYTQSNFMFASVQNIVDMYQMPLFAIASGFLFEKVYWKNNELNFRKYNHQLLNIVFLYFLWEIIFCIVKLFASSHVNNEITISHLLFIPFKAVGPFWYFYVLVELYIFFGIKKIHDIPKYIFFPFSIILALIGSFFRIYEIRWFEYASFLFYQFFFFYGILLAKVEIKTLWRNFFVLISLSISVILISYNWSFETEIYYMPIISLIIAICLSFLIVEFLKKIKIISFVNYVGKHCIELYTMHIFFTSGCRLIVRKLSIGNVYLTVLLIYFISIFAPLILARLFNYIKVYDYFYYPIDVVSKRFSKECSNDK